MNTAVRKQILDAFNFRHACKVFDDARKIPQEDFHFILETARLSPSSFGFEPWRFLVIQDEQLREKLKPICKGAQGQLPTASHFMIILARKEHSLQFGSNYVLDHMRDISHLPEDIVQMVEERYRDFQLHDFKLTESPRALFDWACKQTYIALGNMMTAAAEIGIDSCPIEGFDRDSVETLLSAEGVTDTSEFGVSVMVAFGYRAGDPKPKTRFEQKDVVQWVSSK